MQMTNTIIIEKIIIKLHKNINFQEVMKIKEINQDKRMRIIARNNIIHHIVQMKKILNKEYVYFIT
jgi:diphthamide synthase subunit DPH2